MRSISGKDRANILRRRRHVVGVLRSPWAPNSTTHHCGDFIVVLATARLRNAEGREPNLLCKVIGCREVAVPVHEHAPNHEYRIVRGGDLAHAARYLSFP